MKKGKIITLEGLDCSFKETNSKKLYKAMNVLLNDTRVNLVSFPRYDYHTGKPIKKYLSGELNLTKDEIIELYANDRLDYIKNNNVKERLEKGEWFIFDRYVESNVIYQSADLNGNDKYRMFDKILEKEYIENELPKPDLILVLKSDLELVYKVLKEKRSLSIDKDINESNNEYMKQCFYTLDTFVDWYSNDNLNIVKVYEYINNEYVFKSKEKIFGEIMDIVLKLI